MLKKTTTQPTEADFEAEIHHLIKLIFPWLPAESIRHQTQFSFRFGQKVFNVDNSDFITKGKSRADIIILKDEVPLAVLELKRKGIELTDADAEQGLSYAMVLNPSPPLVVVTNGDETRFFVTHTKQAWKAENKSEENFQQLVTNAASVATKDLKFAIDILMGTNPNIWKQAIAHTTNDCYKELEASWDTPTLPFVPNFSIPRYDVLRAMLIQAYYEEKVIIIEGPPLIGKSNVLRQICEFKDSAALYIEGGVGRGIFQIVADMLSKSLNWPLTKEDARNWLINLSNKEDDTLYLAVDNINFDDKDTIKDIEDLISSIFGKNLVIFLAMDDTVAEKLIKTPNGRTLSKIGRNTKRIKINTINDQEFGFVQNTLSEHNIYLMHGAFSAPEYRQPWVLRSICATLFRKRDFDNKKPHLLPSMLSIDIFLHIREIFTDSELRRKYHAVASAILQDIKDGNRNRHLLIESTTTYVVRRTTVLKFLTEADLISLVDQGYLKPAMHKSSIAVLYSSIPELIASELAVIIATELLQLIQYDPKNAAEWLVNIASILPMGDIIAAQAMVEVSEEQDGIQLLLLEALINSPPQSRSLSIGSTFLVHIPQIGEINMTLLEDCKAELVFDGKREIINLDEDHELISSIYPWLILSHFASQTIFKNTEKGKIRLDAEILLQVGTSKCILRRSNNTPELDGILVHNIPDIGAIVSYEMGVVEPITLSILSYLHNEGINATEWIDRAIATESMPLIARIHIALLTLSNLDNEEIRKWVQEILSEKISVALSKFPKLH
ncbi:type I restriction endonuclease [Acinetobacter proteolyticus]|uniref:type I restriction endonuclease n=1 Tax=Acinetobacter proteolyticus TaxID=1776741 RepID=UPI0031DBDD3C